MEATFVCSILLLCFFDATAALCTGRSPISPVQLLSAVTERAAFSRRGDVAVLAQYIRQYLKSPLHCAQPLAGPSNGTILIPMATQKTSKALHRFSAIELIELLRTKERSVRE